MAVYGLIVLVAVLHVIFMCLEVFRWTWFSVRIAGLSPEVAEATKPLGANQGLYNGFLAAGLVWSLCAGPSSNTNLAVFFLACVLIAGIVGFLTIKPPNFRILIAQSLFATLALIALWANGGIIGKAA
jgi:putative membrane protein